MDPNSTTQQRNTSSGVRKSVSARSKYASRACQECRRRKAKCDGGRVSCARCLRRGIECKYTAEDDNRGTAPKSLVHLLQSRIKVLEEVLWLHSIDINTSIAELRTRGSLLTNGTSESTTPSSTSQQVPTETDGALCSHGQLNFDDDGEARYFGSSSGRVELLQSAGVATEDQSTVSPDELPRFSSNMYSQAVDSTTEISQELKDHLICLYFEWEQPWCQLVDESLFRQSWQNNGRYCSPLLLNCIFALGSRYSDRTEVRSSPDDPNTAGQLFLETAEVLLHFDLKSPSITTIQSLGMMAILYVATGSDAKGWMRHGMAIRLALDMGFNLDSSSLARSHRLPVMEIKLREQIYWALYCTDKLWASYTGRVCTMLDFQSTVALPPPVSIDDNGHLASSGSKRRSILSMLHRTLCTQCQILERILVNLYAPRSLPHGAHRQSFFDSCLLELKSWKYHLPVDLQARNLGDGNTIPHAYLLNMVYHTSIILLAKPFLPKRLAQLRTQIIPSPMIDEITTKAASLCMEAARDICLLGKRYREAFGSFRRSPLTATHCTLSAALMILCNLGDGKSHNADMDLVETCLVTFSELSDSWMPAQRYWRSVTRVVRDRQRSRSGNSRINASTRPFASSSADPDEEESISNAPTDFTQDASQLALSYPWVEDSSLLGMAAEDLDFASLFPSGSAFTHDELMMLNMNMSLGLDSTTLAMVDASLGDVDNEHSHLHNRI